METFNNKGWIEDSGVSRHYHNSDEGLFNYSMKAEKILVKNGNTIKEKSRKSKLYG
jgi:hypothetical protein